MKYVSWMTVRSASLMLKATTRLTALVILTSCSLVGVVSQLAPAAARQSPSVFNKSAISSAQNRSTAPQDLPPPPHRPPPNRTRPGGGLTSLLT
ncbi:MAG: hypothetical protein AAGD25_05815 [Cyanobacteria bacterium P01_F01_bin.150]